jgi:lysophospholipid acyltransferase (LPLAT)-like uncharacterized protein
VINSWDHMTINLPFSRIAVVVGRPIFVRPEDSIDGFEPARVLVETSLGQITDRAYSIVDRVKSKKA